MHGGSDNHGCEALARTIACLLGEWQIEIYSQRPEEDIKYSVSNVTNIISILKQGKRIIPHRVLHIILKAFSMISRSRNCFFRYSFWNLLSSKDVGLYISIGGDNYCYGAVDELVYINKYLNKRGKRTSLLGCSIEPEILAKHKIQEDMKRYAFISARESITYQALLEAGIKDNVYLIPDPAFALSVAETPLPDNFIQDNTIGVNISPLIQNREKIKGITYANFTNLVEYILKSTNCNVALIPHVVMQSSNDLEPLRSIFNVYKHTNRICLIDNEMKLNCMELKYIISKCSFMIAARTHASIAAYSTCVPALVVGYSVKANGIAKDIFGSYEDYVIPVQSLQDVNDLQLAFQKLFARKHEIELHLRKQMPSYIQRSFLIANEVRKVMRT